MHVEDEVKQGKDTLNKKQRNLNFFLSLNNVYKKVPVYEVYENCYISNLNLKTLSCLKQTVLQIMYYKQKYETKLSYTFNISDT